MNDITMRPSMFFWIGKNMVLLLLVFCSLIAASILANIYILLTTIGVSTLLYASFFATIYCTCWTITDEQIRVEKGVFTKRIDFVELYRINDYQIVQSFWGQITNIYTIAIKSTDNSTQITLIEGIKNAKNIVEEMRKRVEKQKKNKNLHEFLNFTK